VENLHEAKKAQTDLAIRRRSPRDRDSYLAFDRAFYMYVRTSGGVTLWNRSRSMLNNGYRPSAVALKLYQDFGVRIGAPSPDADPERDREVIDYFASLIIPEDAVAAPSIFDEGGRA
jgi:hypothetical protein